MKLFQPTREERVRTAKLNAYYERLNKATAKAEREELNALLTDEQKALTPCVDFGFVDEGEGPTPFDIWAARGKK